MKVKKESYKPIIVVLGLICIMMFFYNILTPYIADDWYYSGARSVREVFANEYQHYFTTNGRSLAHVMARFLLMAPKMIFNVLNTGMYLLLICLIYLHAAYGLHLPKRVAAGLLGLIHLLLFNYVVHWGQVSLWLDGACNYLWTMVIMLSYLMMFRVYDEHQDTFNKHKILWLLLGTIAGGLAGWCNENSSGGVILLSMIFIVRFALQKYKLKLWMFTGLLMSIITFFIMIMAPGNRVRSQAFTDKRVWYIKIADHFRDVVNHVYKDYKYLLIVVVVLAVLCVYYQVNKKNMLRIASYALTSLAVFIALILSPVSKGRPFFGGSIYLILVCVALIGQLWSNRISIRAVLLSYAGIMGLIFCVNLVNATMDLTYYKIKEMRRTNFVQSYKDAGYTNVVVNALTTLTDYHPAHGLEDIKEDPGKPMASFYSTFMGMDSVTGVSDEDFEKIFYKGSRELINTRDLHEYLRKLNDPRYTVVIAAKGSFSECLDDEAVQLMHDLGLVVQDIQGNNYIAIVSENNVLVETSEEGRSVYQTELDGKNLSVKSSEGASSIVLDGYDYARNIDGLNFVIYDHESGRVVDRVAFEAGEEIKAWR